MLGTKGSGITALGHTVFDTLEITAGEDPSGQGRRRAAHAPRRSRRRALGRGRGLAGLRCARKRRRAASSGRPDAEIQRILAKQPALQRVTMPANSYAGQKAPVDSVGSWSYVFANAKMPDETAYLLARAIHRAEAPLASWLEQARETTMANTVTAAPRPELIHPGVQKYLREAGLLR